MAEKQVTNNVAKAQANGTSVRAETSGKGE